MTEAATIDRSLQPREYALIPIAVALGMLLVYDLPFIGLPMAALVLGRLVFAGKPDLAVIAVVLAGLGSAATDIVKPVMVVPTMGSLIWGARAIVTWRPWQVVAVLTLVATVTLGASMFIDAAIEGVTVGESVTEVVDLYVEGMDATFDTAQADPAARTAYRDVRDTFRTGLLQVLPGLLIFGLFIAAGLATSALARLSAAHERPVAGYKPLTSFTVPIYVVLALAAGLGLTAWALYTDAEGTVFGAVALNTLVLSASAVMLQGLAVTDTMMRRFRMGPILRLIGYVGLVLTSTFMPLLAILGTADFWLDIRKLRQVEDPGEATEDGGVE